MKKYVIMAEDYDYNSTIIGVFDDRESAKEELERWSCYTITDEVGTIYVVQMPLMTYKCRILEFESNKILTDELI